MADEMSSRPQPDGQIKWDDPNQPADAGQGQSGTGQDIQGTQESSRGRRHHQYQDTTGGQGQQGGYSGQQGGYNQGQQGGQQGGYNQGQQGGQQGGYDQGQQGGYQGGQQGGQQGGYGQDQQGGYGQGQQGDYNQGQQGVYDQGQQGGYQGQQGGQQGGYQGQPGGQQGGYQGQPGGAPGGTFDLNDPQQRQAAQQWLQQFQGGNTQQLPHQDLGNMFHGWANQAEPQHVVDATAHAVEQMPPQQRAGFIQSITGWLQQHGISPAQAGVKTTDPAQMSPQDVGNLVGYAQKQNPDIIKQLFSNGGMLSNPVVQVGLAGLLAYAASQAFKRPGQ